VIMLLLSCNFILIFLLIDQGITASHLDSSVSFLARRNNDLLSDISDVYLCSNASGLIESSAGVVKLNGVTLYINDGIVVSLGLKGEPRPRLKCTKFEGSESNQGDIAQIQ